MLRITNIFIFYLVLTLNIISILSKNTVLPADDTDLIINLTFNDDSLEDKSENIT